MTKQDYIALRDRLNFEPSSDWLLKHFAGDWLLLCSAALWIKLINTFNLPGQMLLLAYLPATILLAIFYFRAFAVMHEAVHGTVTRNRRANDFIGLLYGAVCFLPFEHWREIHLLHHRWAGNVEKDPVMKLVLDFRKPATSLRDGLSALWRSWFPVLAMMQNMVFWSVSLKRYRLNKSPKRLMSLAIPLVAWAAVGVAVGASLLLLVVVPSILIYLVAVEVVNFPHHLSLPQFDGETKLPLWEQHHISRTCIYSRLFARFVLLNFNYHSEHHLFPTLPWSQLDSLDLKEELEGYNYSLGHAWITENRKKPLEEVTRAPDRQKAA